MTWLLLCFPLVKSYTILRCYISLYYVISYCIVFYHIILYHVYSIYIYIHLIYYIICHTLSLKLDMIRLSCAVNQICDQQLEHPNTKMLFSDTHTGQTLSKLASTWLPSALREAHCEDTHQQDCWCNQSHCFLQNGDVGVLFAGHEIQHHRIFWRTFLAMRLFWHGSMFKATQNRLGHLQFQTDDFQLVVFGRASPLR